MSKRIIVMAGGLAVLAITLAALPGLSAAWQEPERNSASTKRALRAEVEQAVRQAARDEEMANLREKLALLEDEADSQDVVDADETSQETQVFTLDDGASWLGVETAEVSGEKAKELKLPAERGVLLTEIVPDSPAAKAGLKANDVVTEFNGQHVEGTAQFRRMIHETPSGRAVQLTVWREGRSQTISATLGKSESRHALTAIPREGWRIEMPRMPRVEIPRFEWNDGVFFSRRPMLGISADDLSGQLGSYFGAPDGEGVLVREVNSGSPAEKAGIKAGDVIIKVDGERVRTVGDLHEKMSHKLGEGTDKAEKATVNIGLLRDRKETTVKVELERPQTPKARRLVSRRTNI
ncbi:MAG TPA: PDZ domain-containing protein [Candidatus Acidoferrales bacterium]|nr:PDZ domain-containing protein [Candidatus Acidoferrales bacterium]